MDNLSNLFTPDELLVNRNIKDSVFRNLFSDKKYLFQLYQALHPEDKDSTIDDLEYVTLENILVYDIYNDLGFMVGKRLLILIEAQSTWTVNILLRCFLYLSKTIQDYLSNSGQSLFDQKPVSIPEPELYVIYTGNVKINGNSISLSEEFFDGKETSIDVKVKVITYGEENNIINQYIIFTKVIDDQIRQYGRNRIAITEAIRICKDFNVLTDYLNSREREVMDIMIKLYDQDEVIRDYVISKNREVAMAIAKRCYNNGISIDIIAKSIGVSDKTIKDWLDIA